MLLLFLLRLLAAELVMVGCDKCPRTMTIKILPYDSTTTLFYYVSGVVKLIKCNNAAVSGSILLS